MNTNLGYMVCKILPNGGYQFHPDNDRFSALDDAIKECDKRRNENIDSAVIAVVSYRVLGGQVYPPVAPSFKGWHSDR